MYRIPVWPQKNQTSLFVEIDAESGAGLDEERKTSLWTVEVVQKVGLKPTGKPDDAAAAGMGSYMSAY